MIVYSASSWFVCGNLTTEEGRAGVEATGADIIVADSGTELRTELYEDSNSEIHGLECEPSTSPHGGHYHSQLSAHIDR